jgi:hypothetical protein
MEQTDIGFYTYKTTMISHGGFIRQNIIFTKSSDRQCMYLDTVSVYLPYISSKFSINWRFVIILTIYFLIVKYYL